MGFKTKGHAWLDILLWVGGGWDMPGLRCKHALPQK